MFNKRLKSITDAYQARADRRQARRDAMDSEQDSERSRMRKLKPEGSRPERHSRSSFDFTAPERVGGSGYIPAGMTQVDNRPIPTMRRGR